MKKIPFDQFEKIMAYNVVELHTCIEILFYIDNSKVYDMCWMGKSAFGRGNQAVYWFGLVKDGSQGYDYDSYETFIKAPVFDGHSLEQMWSLISIIEIDGFDADLRLPYYLGI